MDQRPFPEVANRCTMRNQRGGAQLGSSRWNVIGGPVRVLPADVGRRINRALIEEMNVIPDFREPDNIRLGLTPMYTSFQDVWESIDRIQRVVTEKRHLRFPETRQAVT